MRTCFPTAVGQEIIEYLPENDIPVITLSNNSVVEEPMPLSNGGKLDSLTCSPLSVYGNLVDVG